MIPINEQPIRQYLADKHFYKNIEFHIFESIHSTNKFLSQYPHQPAISVCCAETQTAGKGRFNRSWYSPFGENIYCSIRWPMQKSLSSLTGLSLVVSLSIKSCLQYFGIGEYIQVKWPNDLLYEGKKLCGCLLEVSTNTQGKQAIIIGIGLNIHSIMSQKTGLEKACSLYDITGITMDRNLLISELIIQLDNDLQRLTHLGFSHFLSQWQMCDYLQGRSITVTHLEQKFTGIAQGVNELGQLKLIEKDGTLHTLSVGDTSLSVE